MCVKKCKYSMIVTINRSLLCVYCVQTKWRLSLEKWSSTLNETLKISTQLEKKSAGGASSSHFDIFAL